VTRAVASVTARTIRGTGALTAPRFPHVTLLLGFLLACKPRPDAAPSDTQSAAAASPTGEGRDPIDLLRDLAPQDTGDLIHVVVAIPVGTNEKWEVDNTSGTLMWTEEDGRPRVVAYLPYPGNAGFVQRTLLPRELGGDGGPLGSVTSLGELEMRHPAALRSVSDWFAHAKGLGLLEVRGAADRATADSLLQAAIAAFRR
jgi:inorganic pyrophosphatase